ncbi:hypothetical protein [Alcanivorax sp.]|uniref:TadE/TadG family type IV pilus assembly protein n=1 Tax=Alcanivorax sp. TaxID=1872427 RepID=UPI0032D95E55
MALEFLLLFPFVISLIYAAGVYGVMFTWQFKMQAAVDRSAAAVMALDRGSTSEPAVAAAALASGALEKIDLTFLGSVSKGGVCTYEAGSPDMIVCELGVPLDGGCPAGVTTAGADAPKQLGFFGGFPPLPDCLVASARVAF